MKSKKRSPSKQTLLLVILCLLAIGVVAAYLWRQPTKTVTPEESLQFSQDPPKEFCSSEGQLCLTAPADWLNLGTDPGTPHMQLRDVSDNAQIIFSHDVDSKREACAAGDCLLTVVSVDDVSALPDAVLVKAVSQRKQHGAHVASIFLLSRTYADKYDMRAGETVDLGVNELPTFARKLDGKLYTQHLEGAGMKPGNYPDVAQAQKWFDSKHGKTVDAILRSVRVP